MACSEWQGWGDSRIRVRTALATVDALQRAGIRGTKDFADKCRRIGAYENALVPDRAIEGLVSANMNPMLVDTSRISLFAWVLGSDARSSATKAIQGDFLRAVYDRFRIEHGKVQVFPVIRAALRGMLRNGSKSVTVDMAAKHADAEIRSSLVGASMLPASQRARIAAGVIAIVAISLMVTHNVLKGMYPLIYQATMVTVSEISGLHMVYIPFLLLFVALTIGSLVPLVVWARSANWHKARNAVRYTAPIVAAYVLS